MKFLVVEGVDGSGKSTQIRYILKYLKEKQIPCHYLHFPRTEAPYYGEMIARFLRGDFGSLHTVDPYLVAFLYAGDRKDAAGEIDTWLKEGHTVILDRYVYSNVAFQCAKLAEKSEQEKLRNWILDLEYRHHGIPRPDLNILLDVPDSFTREQLLTERKGVERDYLRGSRDIHEADLSFQQKVREMYHWQAGKSPDLKIIPCTGDRDDMLTPEQIFSRILQETLL